MPRPARPYTMRYAPLRKWSVPVAGRRTAARIEDAKAALFDILAVWNEVDQGVVADMEDRISELDAWLEQHRRDLGERINSGEEIGR